MCNHCDTGVILSNGFCDMCGNNAIDDINEFEEWQESMKDPQFLAEYMAWQDSMNNKQFLTEYEAYCKAAKA